MACPHAGAKGDARLTRKQQSHAFTRRRLPMLMRLLLVPLLTLWRLNRRPEVMSQPPNPMEMVVPSPLPKRHQKAPLPWKLLQGATLS